MALPWHTWRDQRTKCRSHLPHSTLWVLRVELRSSGLEASAIWEPIFPPPLFHLFPRLYWLTSLHLPLPSFLLFPSLVHFLPPSLFLPAVEYLA